MSHASLSPLRAALTAFVGVLLLFGVLGAAAPSVFTSERLDWNIPEATQERVAGNLADVDAWAMARRACGSEHDCLLDADLKFAHVAYRRDLASPEFLIGGDRSTDHGVPSTEHWGALRAELTAAVRDPDYRQTSGSSVSAVMDNHLNGWNQFRAEATLTSDREVARTEQLNSMQRAWERGDANAARAEHVQFLADEYGADTSVTRTLMPKVVPIAAALTFALIAAAIAFALTTPRSKGLNA